MKTCSTDLRRKVVEAYKSGRSGSYLETAQMFGIGAASVSRWLRLDRETGALEPRPRPGKSRKIDLDWLCSHAQEYSDARLTDRADAWEAHSGIRLHITTIGRALRAIGWTYKKNSNGKRTRASRRPAETTRV